MNQLLQQMLEGVSGGTIDQAAHSAGVDRGTVEQILKQAGPLLGQAMKNTAQDDSNHAIEDVLDDGKPDTFADGNVLRAILDHVGGEQIEKLAQNTGVDAKQAQGVLEKLAPAMLGNISTQGLDKTKLLGLLDGVSREEIQGIVMDYIDQDNDGQIIDDLPGLFQRIMRWVRGGSR